MAARPAPTGEPSGGVPLIEHSVGSQELQAPVARRSTSLSVLGSRDAILGRRSPRATTFQPWRRPSPRISTEHSAFLALLREVTAGFYETRGITEDLDRRTGVAIDSLSHEQRQQIEAMRGLQEEVERTGHLSTERADSFRHDLEALHTTLREAERVRFNQLHELLQREAEERNNRQNELAAGVEQSQEGIRAMQRDIQRWAEGQLTSDMNDRITQAINQVQTGPSAAHEQQMINNAVASLMPTIQQTNTNALAQNQPLPESPRNDENQENQAPPENDGAQQQQEGGHEGAGGNPPPPS